MKEIIMLKIFTGVIQPFCKKKKAKRSIKLFKKSTFRPKKSTFSNKKY